MGWTAVIPEWVVPPWHEVSDLQWLSYREHAENRSAAHAGTCAALAWVLGGRAAPVTERTEQPVTEALATAEVWAATAAEDPSISPPPLEKICGELGVAFWPLLPAHPLWASGAYLTLRWLLGLPGFRGHEPPMPLPERNLDGSVRTARQLYEAAVAADPFAFREPEQRLVLRRRVEDAARRTLRLAERVADTKRRYGRAG